MEEQLRLSADLLPAGRPQFFFFLNVSIYLYCGIIFPPLVLYPRHLLILFSSSSSSPRLPRPQCACCRALWQCDGLLRRERAARLAGQPASTHHPSARHAVVPEFCWELSACLCLFVRRLLTPRKDTRTQTHTHCAPAPPPPGHPHPHLYSHLPPDLFPQYVLTQTHG